MINWDEVQKVIFPIKSFEVLAHQFQISYGYAFVREAFNFTVPELEDYTCRLLGGDSRGRYTEYLHKLTGIMAKMSQAGIQNILDLKERTRNREQLEEFTSKSGITAPQVVMLLKYLIYWFVPSQKYLSGLVRKEDDIDAAIKALAEIGIRTNLQLLQAGITPSERNALADQSGLSPIVISDLVNRADLSRLPWASKATISNIIGAGYGSLTKLANANPEQLFTDFFAYGKSIGKNLKLGNEIENSYRIARLVPIVVQER